MLSKLIKYDMKAMSHWLLPIYALALLLTPLERLAIEYINGNIFNNDLNYVSYAFILNLTDGIRTVITFAFVIVLIAVVVATSFLIIYRFYKNLVTNEGYLMHTLPVKTSQLIWSKVISSTIWYILSLMIVVVCLIGLVIGSPEWNEFFSSLPEAIAAFFAWYDNTTYAVLLIIEVVAIAILSFPSTILMFYASIALGQLITKHKILGAFGAYFLMTTALQFLSTLIVIPFFTALIETPSPLSYVALIVTSLYPAGIAALIFVTAFCYFITSYIFKKKLNLE